MSFVELGSDPPSPESNPAEEGYFTTPDDAVFYPEADDDLKIVATNLQDLHRQAYFQRYGTICSIIDENISEIRHIADIGSGSGFGTNILKLHFGSKAYGVELGERQRSYAERAYPETIFREEPYPQTDLMIFAGSAQRMSELEFRHYVEAAAVVVIMVPQIKGELIGVGGVRYSDATKLHSFFRRHGFEWATVCLQTNTIVPEYGPGDQYFFIYAKQEVVDE